MIVLKLNILLWVFKYCVIIELLNFNGGSERPGPVHISSQYWYCFPFLGTVHISSQSIVVWIPRQVYGYTWERHIDQTHWIVTGLSTVKSDGPL